jgi:hypothetical protein
MQQCGGDASICATLIPQDPHLEPLTSNLEFGDIYRNKYCQSGLIPSNPFYLCSGMKTIHDKYPKFECGDPERSQEDQYKGWIST